MKFIGCIVALFVITAPCLAQKSTPKALPETSHLVFVTEYIRELSAIEDIRDSSQKELESKDKQDTMGTFLNAVHASTLFQLELGSQVRMLKGMRLNRPYEWIIPSIVTFDENKIEAFHKIETISTTFLSGPKPGVDYGKLSAEMTKARASLDYIDKSLFQASPAIFSILIDTKEDSQGHASHLIITKAEREKLIGDIDLRFGTKLDAKDQNYGVSSASVLKDYLLKDFKSSGDPWE
jgi:hypothetical protein